MPADVEAGSHLDQTLTKRLSGELRAETTTSSERLRRLIEVGIALSSELSLEALLRKLIETAVELTGARYGALGVIDRLGTGLEQFITVGVDAERQAMIGDLPHGLGLLIRERRPLRLAELTQDPRSVGFPPGHPPMGSFLGVPILVRGTAFGNLYLTEKAGGEEFNNEDEEIVQLLAAQAAAARSVSAASRRWSTTPSPQVGNPARVENSGWDRPASPRHATEAQAGPSVASAIRLAHALSGPPAS
jgi:signal transduction protein with GAF and PtsI domain